MKLVDEDGNALSCIPVDVRKAALLSKERLKILQLLSRQPMYAAEIAREMKMGEQALSYHLKLLQKTGMVKFKEYEERRGGIAKRFISAAEGFAVITNNNAWKRFAYSKTTPKIFTDFVQSGIFDGKFVVGSPDPHGKYRARGSEFPILELAMLLGNYATFSFPLYLLDTQLKEEDKKQNLIIAGGPKVNVLTSEINRVLPISFDRETFEIYSRFSKKRYSGNIGVIELLPNPFSKKFRILIVGGLNHHGTRAATLALIKKMNKLNEGNHYNRGIIARVVEGFDENGDGVVDAVEVLE